MSPPRNSQGSNLDRANTECAVQNGLARVDEPACDQIHQDCARAEREQLNLLLLLLEGLDSGEPLEFTDDWWDQKQAKLSRRASDSAL